MKITAAQNNVTRLTIDRGVKWRPTKYMTEISGYDEQGNSLRVNFYSDKVILLETVNEVNL